eukprot:gene21942-16395_t
MQKQLYEEAEPKSKDNTVASSSEASPSSTSNPVELILLLTAASETV